MTAETPPTEEESAARIARVKALFAKSRGSLALKEAHEAATAAIIGVRELQRFKLAFEMPTVADRHLVVASIKTALGADRGKAEEAALFVAKVAQFAPLVDMSLVHVPWRSTTPRSGERPWEQWGTENPAWDPRSGRQRPQDINPDGTRTASGRAAWDQFNQIFNEHLRGSQAPPTEPTMSQVEMDIFLFFSSIGSVLGIDDDGILRRARSRQARVREEAPPPREEARDIIDTFLRRAVSGTAQKRKKKGPARR